MNKKTVGIIIVAIILLVIMPGFFSHRVRGQERNESSREDDIQLIIECYEDAHQVFRRLKEDGQLNTAIYVDIPNTAALLFYYRTGMIPVVGQTAL